MCNKLYLAGVIDEYEHECLTKVIDRRNFMVHEFFNKIRTNPIEFERIEETLNRTFYVINEARDVVANRIDKLKEIALGERTAIFNKWLN